MMPDECKALTSYSARRCMTSLADRLSFPLAERLKLGCWNSEEIRMVAKQAKMPDHYSHHRLRTALVVKQAVTLAAVNLALRPTAGPDAAWIKLGLSHNPEF